MNTLAADKIYPRSLLDFRSLIRIGEDSFLGVERDSVACSKPSRMGPSIFRNDFFLRNEMPWQPARRENLAEFSNFEGELPKVEWEKVEIKAFEAEFERIRGEISRGRWQKAVPILTENGKITSGDPAAFSRLVPPMGRGRFFYFDDGASSGMAGVTPERLLSVKGRRLETAALAGTARIGDASSLMRSEKEREEHECVADFIEEALEPFGRVVRGTAKLKPVGGLAHLMTPFVVELHEGFDWAEGINDLIRVLHPTPAVGIAPRTDESLQELDEIRSRLGTPADFAAPFGYIDDGQCEIHVAIRCVLWEDGQVRLPSGVGIVAGSQLEHEIRELRLKRDSVKEMLGLA